MSLQVNTDALKSQVIPALNKTKENLSSAKEIISSIEVPSDFTYASTIKRVINDITNTEKATDKFYNYVDDKISKLSNAEKTNENVVDNIFKIDFNNEFNLVGAVESTGAVVKEKGEDLLNNTISLINYVTSENFLNDLDTAVAKTRAEIKENVKNFIHVSIETGAQIGTYVLNKFKESFLTAYKVGCKIVEGVKCIFSNLVVPAFKIVGRTAATVVNIAISIIEGLVKLVGSILDAAILFGANRLSNIAIPIDGIQWVVLKLLGNEDEYISFSGIIMKATMSFVAEQPVENAFRSFYENNSIGKTLDKYAFSPFKNAGTGSKIVQGIGEIGGIVVLTIATMGAFGVAAGSSAAAGTAAGTVAGTVAGTATAATGIASSTTVGAVITATSAFGKYTGERWAEYRDASWEGVERLHNSGKMSDDMYYSYITVRCLSENEWNSIEDDWKNGKITDDQYKQMKQIRELPEEWTTKENCLNGLVYGASNAAWEGLQFYLGGKLASWGGIEGSKLATSAVRVGADTAFNAADTPFRALVDSATSDKSIKQAWEDQGGWASVFVNTGIGLAGSIGGEVIDNVKMKKIDEGIEASVNSRKGYDYSPYAYFKYDTAENYIKEHENDIYFIYKGENGTTILPYSKEHINAINNGERLQKLGNNGYMTAKNELMKLGLTSNEAKQMIEYHILNKQDINTKIEFSRMYMLAGLEGYVPPEKIDEAFNNFKIFDSREDFEKEYIKDGGSHDDVKQVMGYNYGGKMYFPPEASTGTIIHEANHSIGNVYTKVKTNMSASIAERYRGTNEAFTEYIARELSNGNYHSDGYRKMTDALEAVNNKLRENGYVDLELRAYFSDRDKGIKKFIKAVDSIGGKGFCNEFFETLNDVHDTSYSNLINKPESEAKLASLVQYFTSK